MRLQLGDSVDVVLEADGPRELLAHGRAELTSGRAEVEERSARRRETPDQIDENAVAAALEVLERIDVRHEGADGNREWLVISG